MSDNPGEPPQAAPFYRLAVGRWSFAGWLSQPELAWTHVIGLEVPERRLLEELAPHVLRLPGVVAVRIDEVPAPPG